MKGGYHSNLDLFNTIVSQLRGQQSDLETLGFESIGDIQRRKSVRLEVKGDDEEEILDFKAQGGRIETDFRNLERKGNKSVCREGGGDDVP
jgi:hypothetical protein